eukprot:m.296672 g.296672  ORF g.296672 m.296672 type:complete len:199 (-) comp13443_c0_seq1:2298-2894(-)
MAGELSCWYGIDLSGAGLAALLLLVLSLVFYGVALGTDHWADADPDSNFIYSVNMGLFQVCSRRCEQYVDNEFLSKASDLNLVTRTEATAAFVIMAALASVAASVMVIFGVGRAGYGSTIGNASGTVFVAALFGMISMSIFADIIRELPARFDPGYSFALETTAWIFNFVAGILLVIDSRNVLYLDEEAVMKGGAGMI